MKNNKQLIIIPAFNEASVLDETIKEIRKTYKNADIVVVDDGSRDNTAKVALESADYLLTHRHNCGLGAALSTGIEFAKRRGYSACLTFDADGQHDPKDIASAFKAIESGSDVVIGSRFLGTHSNMPRFRRFILTLSNFTTFIFFGIWTSDSQSGFRGFSRRAIETIKLRTNRMEVSSEIFGQVKRHKLVFHELPIHIRYTDYSLSKGQSNSNGLKILIKLLYQIIR